MEVLQLHSKIAEVSQANNSTKIALGEYLLDIKQGKKYESISGKGSTWKEYLANPEVKISNSSAHRYMTIAQKYIKELGLTYEDLYGLDTWALYVCAKVVDKNNYEEWLLNIKTLSRSDIEHLVKFKGVDQMTCEHDFEPVPAKWKCSVCGAITSHNPNETKI